MEITEKGKYIIDTGHRKGCRIEVKHLIPDKIDVRFIDYTGAWYCNEYKWFLKEDFYRLFTVVNKYE
jgi:hypothetical protein